MKSTWSDSDQSDSDSDSEVVAFVGFANINDLEESDSQELDAEEILQKYNELYHVSVKIRKHSSDMKEKLKNLETEKKKIDKMLSIGKSSGDKTGLGFDGSTNSSSGTTFVKASGDKRWFQTFSDKKVRGTVTFGDGKKAKVSGEGTVTAPGLPALHNVLLVENLTANLMSISQLCDDFGKVIFDEIECIVSTKTGEKVICGPRSDDNCYCAMANGISHEFSAPITPQQNGVVERKNRVLLDMSRVMLNSANLAKHFWAEAISSACYTANRVYLRPKSKATPYELWKGKKPNVKQINDDDDLTGMQTEHRCDQVQAANDAFSITNSEDIHDTSSQTLRIGAKQVKRDHKPENIIGKLHDKMRTRSQDVEEISYLCYVSQIEPKNVKEAIVDNDWILAIQEELNQFERNDVWYLVPRPKDANVIGTKWIFRNKTDEKGKVIRNKARLVAQGYTQVEGLDFDETFAPVARLESVRLLLAIACHLGIKLYRMDVKSAFRMESCRKKFTWNNQLDSKITFILIMFTD
ncbi:unnamed protein product [Prunus brigantina]